MKAAETRSTAKTDKKGNAFFGKESSSDFFNSKTNDPAFFTKNRSSIPQVQTKLTIGQSNDKYEKEADATADKVLQRLSEPASLQKKPLLNEPASIQKKSVVPITSITPLVQTKCATCDKEEKLQKKEEKEEVDLNEKLQKKPIFESNAVSPDENSIQRKCAECEKEEKKIQARSENTSAQTASPSIESSLSSSKGSGSPLPEGTRSQMESSIGADFSNVRIHTSDNAVQMNKDLNAQAFTHGSDIYFNSGKYDANSKSGQHLLAHELTHTVQQHKNSFIPSNITSLNGAYDGRIQKSESSIISFKSNEELIDIALKENDINAVKHVTDFSSINLISQKLQLIDLLNSEDSIWGRNARAMRLLWTSIGSDFDVVSGQDGGERWKTCFAKVPSLMDDVPAAKHIKDEFKNDVKKLALSYLEKNEITVLNEMTRLGLPEKETDSIQPASKEQVDAMNNIKEKASTVSDLQNSRNALSQIVVGRRKSNNSKEDEFHCSYEKFNQPDLIDEDDKREYEKAKSFNEEHRSPDEPEPRLKHECKVPCLFDPIKQPEYPLRQGEQGQPWENVMDVYMMLNDSISEIAKDPAIYALIGQGGVNPAEGVANASLEDSRKLIGNAFREVLKNIRDTKPKLGDSDDLDYRDLIPIHAQLFGGLKVEKGSGISWNNLVPQSIAKYIVKDHEVTQALIQLGLEYVGQLAFLVAEIASAGTVTFLIAATAAAGAAGTSLAISAENFEDLAKAAKTNVTDKSKIITNGQVNAAELEVALTAVSALLIAAGLGAKVLQKIKLTNQKSMPVPPPKVNPPIMPDAEAFIQARKARNRMVDIFHQMSKVKREEIAVVTGGVNVETGNVAVGYNVGGNCAEDMVVERLGGDASKVKFSEAVFPRTGQQAPVCYRCQTKYGTYGSNQFPKNSTIFKGIGPDMPKAGQ